MSLNITDYELATKLGKKLYFYKAVKKLNPDSEEIKNVQNEFHNLIKNKNENNQNALEDAMEEGYRSGIILNKWVKVRNPNIIEWNNKGLDKILEIKFNHSNSKWNIILSDFQRFKGKAEIIGKSKSKNGAIQKAYRFMKEK